MIIKKDSEIVKAKVERKSIALKAKKESSDEECLTFGSEDEEYAMETFQRSRDDKNGKSDRKCFRCGNPNHLIGECPKPPNDENQRAFVGGSWSDSGEEDDEKVKNETCLVAHASSEICLRVDLESDEWIKDNGCSKHMTGNRKLFSTYKVYNGGNVIFGSNLRGNIIVKGQICDTMCIISFFEHDSEITKDGRVIGLDLTLPLPEHDPLLPRRKRKAIKLEPETYIDGLHCNRTLPEGVKFVKNLVIEKPKHGLFFIDAFGEEAF
ncbi:retrovirus-related pol polyprotein from transposon TNT 1-94 [Tanacetum coccineum]